MQALINDGGLFLSPIPSVVLTGSFRSLHKRFQCCRLAEANNRCCERSRPIWWTGAGGGQLFVHRCSPCWSTSLFLRVSRFLTSPGVVNQPPTSSDSYLPGYSGTISKLTSHKDCTLRSTLGPQSYQQCGFAIIMKMSLLSHSALDYWIHPAIWHFRGLNRCSGRPNRWPWYIDGTDSGVDV